MSPVSGRVSWNHRGCVYRRRQCTFFGRPQIIVCPCYLFFPLKSSNLKLKCRWPCQLWRLSTSRSSGDLRGSLAEDDIREAGSASLWTCNQLCNQEIMLEVSWLCK